MRSFSRIYRLSWVASTAKVSGQTAVDYVSSSVHWHNVLRSSCINCNVHCGPYHRRLCTNTKLGLLWQSSPREMLLRKLETSLEKDSPHETWEAFDNLKSLHGFPDQQLVSRMIISLAYSSKRHWLRKAYELVLVILKEKPGLLHHDYLTRLALALARSQVPVPASTILRIMLEKFKLPPSDILNTLFSHLVRTQIGSCLASEILIEICECYLQQRPVKGSKQMGRPITLNTSIFNLVLESCLRFQSTLKVQQIIEMMSQAGVVADANSIVILAQIYEMIGQRDELKKLKGHIDGVSSVMLNRYYRQFYNSLLSLHFKYNDLDAASDLMLDLYQRLKSLPTSSELSGKCSELQKPCSVQIGSSNLKTGYKIMVDPEKLQNNFVADTQCCSRLVLFSEGKLVPSNKAFAKIINGYVKERKVGKLSNILIDVQKEMDSREANLCSDVIDACIKQGWLETAHDILDNFEAAAIPIKNSTYLSLLRAYCNEKMLEESKVLLKQMRKVGLFENLSDENAISSCCLGDGASSSSDTGIAVSDGKSQLAGFLNSEVREEDLACPLTYEFNSSILFFCKAKMMEDALKTFKRMHQQNIQPTVQTFSHLVNGFSSLKMYRQITYLWGEIKRRHEDGLLTADRDLFDCLMCNFLKGGYFERVMEIVNYMVKNNMYIDKWKYKREFLKFHKDLYRSLKASDAKTDAQSRRLEHVQSFRRWVGIEKKS